MNPIDLRSRARPADRAAGTPSPGPEQALSVAGIHIEWLFESPVVKVNRWRCRELLPGLTEERWQHWRVFGFVHAGAYELRSPRGTALIDPMRVAFLSPGEPYRTSHPCGCGDRGSSLIVDDALLREMVSDRRRNPADAAALFPQPAGPCPKRAFLLQRLLMRRLEGGEAMEAISVEETALTVAAEILEAALAAPRSAPRPLSSRARRQIVEETRRLLGREFRRPLRLPDIARSAGTTSFHLCRVFQEETGIPIHRYLILLRLRAAVEALAAHEQDLSALALDLGFSSHSHFTYAFRREFGIPPSRFRATPASAPRARFR